MVDRITAAAIWHSAMNCYTHSGIGEQDDDRAIDDILISLETLVSDELTALRVAQQWRGIESAPEHMTFVEVETIDTLEHYPGRRFIAKYIGPDDWAIFPGYGVGDRHIKRWRALQPLPPGDGQ